MEHGLIEEFLRTKGALEIVVEIGRGSASFQDVEDAVLVSSSTVATRLQDGVEKELIEITHRPTDHGTEKRYELTRVGTRVYDRIQEIDVDKTVRNLQRLQRERETDRERLIGRLNRDKLIISYEHERNPPAIPEDTIPPEEALGGFEPPPESNQKAAHRKRLEDDLVGLDEETDDESED
ncbi:hypothetical protein [Haloplanus halophilus]|uniref:hypothetical protein n=1 Tax=Haloplanus halophilus TaxID=2949993 RepID=UPI00203F961D|nr:hypothetical protein [Haloplanus sp. GDY1]